MNSNPGLVRSRSSNVITENPAGKSQKLQNLVGLFARNPSLEKARVLKESKIQQKSFKKCKSSNKELGSCESQELLKGKSRSKVYPTCLKDYALLDEITSKFSLKTVELIKKDFPANELIYSHFLAVLSEIDPIFSCNKQLQFAMSQAKEVFQLYFSRPGHVLNTFKSLPKLTESNRVSKKVISQCSQVLKSTDWSKCSGVTLDIIESLKLIVSIQNKLFKAKVFVPKKQDPDDRADKTLEVSIMELNTQDAEQSVSPVIRTEPAEAVKTSAKSSKKKILDSLFQRIKSESSEATSVKEKTSAKQDCLKELSLNTENFIKPKQKRTTSNSPVPGYMQNLRRKESIESQKATKHSKIISKVLEKKKEWEEVRTRKKEEEENKRVEMLKDIEENRKSLLEMRNFIKQKEKAEKLELLRFKEQELAEQKRLKQLEKHQKKLDFLDEFERNLKKSEMIRSLSENF